MTSVKISSKDTTSSNNNKCTLPHSSTITTTIITRTAEVNNPNQESRSGPPCNQATFKPKWVPKSTIRTLHHPKTLLDPSQHQNWAKRLKICKTWKIKIISTHQELTTKEFRTVSITFQRIKVQIVHQTNIKVIWTNSTIITISTSQIRISILRISHSKASILIMVPHRPKEKFRDFNNNKISQDNTINKIIPIRINWGPTTTQIIILARIKTILLHRPTWANSCWKRAPAEACIHSKTTSIVTRSIWRVSTLPIWAKRMIISQTTRITRPPLIWVNTIMTT